MEFFNLFGCVFFLNIHIREVFKFTVKLNGQYREFLCTSYPHISTACITILCIPYPSVLPPNPCKIIIFFFPISIVLPFTKCHIVGIIQYVAFFRLTSFTLEYRFSFFHVLSCMAWLLISCWIIFYCVDAPRFIYSFTCWWTSQFLLNLDNYK